MMHRLQQLLPQRHTRAADHLVGSVGASCARRAGAGAALLQPGRPAGRDSDRPARRPESAGLTRGFGRTFATLLLALLVPLAARAVPPGTLISNSATLSYTIGGLAQSDTSNQVDLMVRGPATVEFLRYAPTDPTAQPVPVPPTDYRDGGGLFQPVTAPPETATQPLALVDAPRYDAGQTLYLRLTDLDQDLQAGVAETVLVTVTCAATGDAETLRLTETAPDSGIFTGYLPTAPGTTVAADGVLFTTGNCQLDVAYVDAADAADTAADTAQIEPLAGLLWLQKDTTKSVAGIGEIVPYVVRIANTDPTQTAPGVTISDRLPAGFRYQAGSARLDGSPLADPSISTDGRTLVFALGDLAPGASRVLTYVAAVGIGTPAGLAVNEAVAADQLGHSTNRALARVVVREDLLRSRSFLAGRVMIGDCTQDDTAKAGLPGVRIYLEDGSYTVTDADGRYHFEGLTPERHVVQLDLDSVPPMYEVLPCDDNTRFAGRAFSQFVDLQPGTLWRADFHVGLRPRTSGEASLELRGAVSGTEATFTLPLAVGGVPVQNLRLTVLLPAGVRYQPGGSHLDGAPLDDPQPPGATLTFRLGARPAGWRGNVTLSGTMVAEQTEELPVKALLTFDTPQQKNQRTPLADTLLYAAHHESAVPVPNFVVHPHFPSFVAELSAEVKAMLDEVVADIRPFRPSSIYAIGHTDNVRIAPRSRHIFADNFALSKARAASVARYIGDALGLPPSSIGADGVADTQPVDSNATEAGRARNRRVELFVSGMKLVYGVDYGVIKPESGPQRAVTTGLRPGEESTDTAPATAAIQRAPQLDQQWLASLAPETRIVWPEDGYVPEIPSLAVVVQYRRGDRVELRLNDAPVDPRNFDQFKAVPNGDTVVSSWAGLDLANGRNRLEASIFDGDGRSVATLQRDLWFVSEAQRVELLEERSQLLADGRRAPVLALRLTDEAGHPLHPGRQVAVSVSAPYRAQMESAESATTPANVARVVTGPDGVALLRLEPTTRTGEVRVAVPLGEQREEVSAWLQPQLRDWILVGLAEGTAGYNTVSGNMENLAASGNEEDFYEEGRVAFFAKGRIKGSWLLTLAYDSAKERRDSLHQTIDPDAYYTLYGDGGDQQYEAASARKLYVKLERAQFYALFGDYDTGLTVTELARYNRSLTGLKSERRGETLDWNVFASETAQAFVKDELRGDGTSGLYRLSRRDLVLNSEKVTIERRDRFHSEVVLEVRSLARHLDYEIDYERGTLFFKEPVPSRDPELNPVFIVVDYEAAGRGEQNYDYGGRAALKFLDERVVVGASLIHEGASGSEGNLAGADLTVRLGAQTTVKGEVAASDVAGPGGGSGAAWLAELHHQGPRLTGRAYLREQQQDFGLGQQAASEAGMRKYGALAAYRLSRQFSVNGEYGHQDNLASGAASDLAEAGLAWRSGSYQLSTGLRQANDDLAVGTRNESTQALLGAGWQATPALALRFNHDQSLSGQDASAAYPTRTRLGADYRLSESVSIFGEQEWTQGTAEDTDSTRLGLKTTPWSGAQANSSVEQQVAENGARVFANLGLRQTWRATPRLSLDAGLDRSQTLRHPGNTPVNPGAAPVSGASEDFTAVSAGANWQEEAWSWFSRAEYRTADSEDKWGGALGVMGELRPGFGLSARGQFFLTDAAGGVENRRAETRFGLAWRPRQSRWIVLDRLDLRNERSSGNGAGDFRNWHLVNNLHANLKANRRTQVALQYAFKYVQETVDSRDYGGYTDLAGIEGRYDLTPDWDLGVRGSALHSWESGAVDYAAGLSVGCKVVDNAWVSLGYNFTGFTDPDFSGADFTAQGPYLRMRFKFDQQTLKEALSRL